jgi:hypothetical protein
MLVQMNPIAVLGEQTIGHLAPPPQKSSQHLMEDYDGQGKNCAETQKQKMKFWYRLIVDVDQADDVESRSEDWG